MEYEVEDSSPKWIWREVVHKDCRPYKHFTTTIVSVDMLNMCLD